MGGGEGGGGDGEGQCPGSDGSGGGGGGGGPGSEARGSSCAVLLAATPPCCANRATVKTTCGRGLRGIQEPLEVLRGSYLMSAQRGTSSKFELFTPRFADAQRVVEGRMDVGSMVVGRVGSLYVSRRLSFFPVEALASNFLRGMVWYSHGPKGGGVWS